jgi:hypothetical protein
MMSSRLDNAVINSNAGKTVLGIADDALAKDAERRLAERRGMRWTHFDLLMTVDCGLEFGPN